MAKHFIITNRQVNPPRGRATEEKISASGVEEAGDNLRFGHLEIKRDSRARPDYQLISDPQLTDEQRKELLLLDIEPKEGKSKLGSRRMFEEIHRAGLREKTDEAHLLLFIHDNATDLNQALDQVHYLHDSFVEDKESPIQHLVLFTWPATDNKLDYRDDARDAVRSGYALARAYKKMKRFFRTLAMEGEPFCQQRIHVVAQGMGARVIEAMLEELLRTNTVINSTFGEVFLIAADVDYDSFEAPRPLYYLIESCERVHLYYHNYDEALGRSEYTKDALNRLGRWGAKNSLRLPDDVYQADVTGIEDVEKKGKKQRVAGEANHNYLFNQKAVIDDIIDVLNGRESIFTF
jgi:esterase/lipase superfamily enzyme